MVLISGADHYNKESDPENSSLSFSLLSPSASSPLPQVLKFLFYRKLKDYLVKSMHS